MYHEAAKLIGAPGIGGDSAQRGRFAWILLQEDGSGRPCPTLIVHTEFDSSLEELFFFGPAAATRHGYNCLTFEGRDRALLHARESTITGVTGRRSSRPPSTTPCPGRMSLATVLSAIALPSSELARSRAGSPRVQSSILAGAQTDCPAKQSSEVTCALDTNRDTDCLDR